MISCKQNNAVSTEMKSEHRRLRIVELKLKIHGMRGERDRLKQENARLQAHVATLIGPHRPPENTESNLENAIARLAKTKALNKLLLIAHPDKGFDKAASKVLLEFIQKHKKK